MSDMILDNTTQSKIEDLPLTTKLLRLRQKYRRRGIKAWENPLTQFNERLRKRLKKYMRTITKYEVIPDNSKLL